MDVCVLLLVGGFFLLNHALLPEGMRQRDAESMEYLRTNYPGTAEWVDSMTQVGALRDTFIFNAEGLRLHAFYAQHQEAQGTAVLVHGYTDNALRMMMLGKLYHDSLQFNILLPDHAFHGKSEGEAIQMGWKDRLNIERWTEIADSLWNGSPIYLHGISMGGATVMMCSGDELPQNVRGIIDDCGYTSVWDEFSGEIQNQFSLPPRPLMDIASQLCQWRYGWNFKEASAINQVRKSTLPILFIHGDKDTYVPTWMVYKLFDAKTKGYKRLYIAKGTEHAFSYRDHQADYRREVEDFIEKTRK